MRAQRAHQRQGSRANLSAGHACGQRPPVRLATTRATSGIAPVFMHLRLDRRHIEHLVTNRLVGDHGHRCPTVAELGRRAGDDFVDLGFIQHRPGTALVAHLRPALAAAGAPLGPVGAGRAVRRWWLGRVLRVQRQPLLQHSKCLPLQGELPTQAINFKGQQVNHHMALRHRARLGWDIRINGLSDIVSYTLHDGKCPKRIINLQDSLKLDSPPEGHSRLLPTNARHAAPAASALPREYVRCRVRYDNERSKGDHRHIGENEYAYDFTTVEQLLDDFERDIANWS